MTISFRMAAIEDVQTATALMLLLYKDATFECLLTENYDLLTNQERAVFLAYDDEEAVGFAHCALRHDYVEGTSGGTIGYLEGIFIMQEYRLHNIAESLLTLCVKWAKEKGCHEFASDCEIDNVGSIDFHLKTGFKEANRIVCFVKGI